ncbi:MAG: hypothetical protein N2255_07080 [Kiritimatiellae bacterium]|nr:hypothetical protein [Kiritimatiellia bacterium]
MRKRRILKTAAPRHLWAIVFIDLAVAFSEAGENKPNHVAPELTPDPGVVGLVNKLGDGESVNLPAPKVGGDINDVARRYGLDKHGPGVRDYSIKMVWMPERKRAIFYGANHAVPHRLNDVWEYDLTANTWVCLYAPDANKGGGADWSDVDRESAETKAGIVRTRRGGPAIVGHSWWNMTYDPDLRAMITLCTWSMSDPQLFQLLQQGKHKPPLWAFFPEKKQWEPILGSKGDIPGYENARQMEYVPELGGTVWVKSDGMWLYNSRENTWKRLGKAGDYGEGLPAREGVMVYVPDRKILVAHCLRGEGKPSTGYAEATTHHYIVERNEWKKVFHSTEKNNPPPGFDAVTNFVYDRMGRVCLLWDAVYTKALWAYDPETVSWMRLEPKGPPPPTGRDDKLAYYDEAHNLFVIPGRWVYRHRRNGGR